MAKIRQFSLNKSGSYKLLHTCEDRGKLKPPPRRISNLLHNYLPFDHLNSQRINVSNMLGMKLPDFILKSGQVYDGYDGKRLVYEVGCNSIIYNLVDKKSSNKYHFFIQQMDDFIFDVTTRSVAAKVAKATAPIVTIAKYEMYFLMGLFSTLSIATLVVFVGTEAAIAGITGLQKVKAAKKLGDVLLEEHNNIKLYAPVLHSKLEEFFILDNKINAKNYGKNLPETIIKDEKTQAQLAGVLSGKAVLSAKPFTMWTAVFSILATAATKSITKSPESYVDVIDNKYGSIVKGFQMIDWDNSVAVAKAAHDLKNIIEDSGVVATDKEALAILLEVRKNPAQLELSINNTYKAFKNFQSEID